MTNTLMVHLLTEPGSPTAASVRTAVTGLIDRHQMELTAAAPEWRLAKIVNGG